MEFTTIAQARRDTGLGYIGKVNNGVKHLKAYKYHELVYTIYFAPDNMSGYHVCPGRTPECAAVCLNESGMSLMYPDMINGSRIKKTKLFFEEREFVVKWIIAEINGGIQRAKRLGFTFSVRLNNTSDISPEDFYIIENGEKKNIMQIFPDIQFYDYTKVLQRHELLLKYTNYDLTFSYNGKNINDCLNVLEFNGRVAMVFKQVPKIFLGYQVVNGDLYDMRYKDAAKVIVGLKYKNTRHKLLQTNKFVIQ